MPIFKVTRERAYWVRETQIIVARNEERAEDAFFAQFDPTLEVLDVVNLHGDQLDRGVAVAPVKAEKDRTR